MAAKVAAPGNLTNPIYNASSLDQYFKLSVECEAFFTSRLHHQINNPAYLVIQIGFVTAPFQPSHRDILRWLEEMSLLDDVFPPHRLEK